MPSSFKNLSINDTGYFKLPVGSTAQRVAEPGTVETFTTVETTSWTAPSGVTEVEVLVVAGGGGGGAPGGGGGGGGGVIYRPRYPVTPGQSYTVTVGDGGAAGVYNVSAATNGGNSVFDTLTAIGGGNGGQNSANAGGNGGSGGGGGGGANVSGGAGTQGQGHAGGSTNSNQQGYGGGGGAGGPGGNAVQGGNYSGGAGGPGLPFSISGSVRYYGGGGGGGCYTIGAVNGLPGGGGIGGGGSGSIANVNPQPGKNGTGGGGGGAGGGSGPGSAGGSGIVILAYTADNIELAKPGNLRVNEDNVSQIEYVSPSLSRTNKLAKPNSLTHHFDAGNPLSYNGTGSTWNNLGTAGGNATLANSPVFTDQAGGSFRFIRTLSHGATFTSISTGTSWSAEAWVKSIGYGDQHIISNSSGGPVSAYANIYNGAISYYHYSGVWNGTQGSEVTTGEWVHLAWVQEGTKMRLYVNGEIDTEFTLTSNSGRPFDIIGYAYGGSAQGFDGDIAIVNIYQTTALTPKEVEQNYNVFKGRFTKQSKTNSNIDLGEYIKDDLLIHFDFSDPRCYNGSGDVVRSLTGSVNGTVYNAAFGGSGLRKYFDFERDAGNNYIRLGESIPEQQNRKELTMEAWVYTESIGEDIGSIISSQLDAEQNGASISTDGRGEGTHGGGDNSYHYQLSNDGIWTTTSSYGNTGTNTATTGAWVHVVATKDNAGKWVFEDGVQLGFEGNFTGEIEWDLTWWQIGAEPNGGSPRRFYDGQIAIVRIYNRALTDQEVKYNYNGQKRRFK